MNSSNEFMTQLRAQTSVTHEQLEETALSRSVMAPVVSTGDYALYLKAMYAVHTGIEANVFPVTAALFPDMDMRRKTALIIHDLEQLGAAVPTGEEPFADEQYQDDLPFNLGILYVSEGSTLGGKVIMKNVRAAAEQDIRNACQFLDAYGDQTGSRWKAFLDTLHTYQEAASDAERARIIEGAVYGFSRVAALFTATSLV